MRIHVLGAGAWGTAVAIAAARHPGGHAVSLFARSAEQVHTMQASRANARYLAGISLPESLQVASWADLDAHAADLTIVATPTSALRAVLASLADLTHPVAWLCKGFEADTGRMPHEVQREAAPALQGGALTGPSFALEVAQGKPAALVAASVHAAVRERLVIATRSTTRSSPTCTTRARARPRTPRSWARSRTRAAWSSPCCRSRPSAPRKTSSARARS